MEWVAVKLWVVVLVIIYTLASGILAGLVIGSCLWYEGEKPKGETKCSTK